MPPPLPTVVGGLSLAGMAVLWRVISSKQKGDKRTLGSLFSQYVAVKAVGWLGRRQRKKLEADTLKVMQVQEETLLKRLRKNADTFYGRKYNFPCIKARHPITTYDHYRELVERIAAGEEKVIIAEKPLILAMTSGTSGKSAMLLSTKDTNTEFFLQEHWQELVKDIEQGTISRSLSLEPKVRRRLEVLMKPDNYCKGVPFYSPFYAATEGLIGVNLWPQEPHRRYLLCPRSMFCEFLPESSLDEEIPQTLLMEEVKEGESYELVITNATGLFRFDFPLLTRNVMNRTFMLFGIEA
ncbi:hypothetical protein GOODEAATRI_016595 [Goodea atripinnis]|uniref:GH3 middle domain-containing protein n=1 Tax=Goodea atripinnis TaxID=208336 RepID=A0ABV0N226_9TELE